MSGWRVSRSSMSQQEVEAFLLEEVKTDVDIGSLPLPEETAQEIVKDLRVILNANT